MRVGLVVATLDEVEAADQRRRQLTLRRLGFEIHGRDVALCAILLAVEVGASLAVAHRHRTHGLGPAGWVLLAVGPVALLAQRRHPVAVLWITLVAAVSLPGARFGYLSLIASFVLTNVAGHRRHTWAAVVVGYVGSLWVVPLVWGRATASLTGALLLGGWLVVLVVVAETVRMRRERVVETRMAREAEARRQASEERLRMARDLHDVIGHNISLINVQAAVGLDLVDTRPEQARESLAAIKAVSKEALGELRAMLAALRQDGDAPRAPAPGLDRLDELAALTRAAGLAVTTEVAGTERPLPAAVDLAAYRIVQESLTNVARHAPGAVATVRVTYQADALLLEVVDDVPAGVAAVASPAPVSGPGAGSGIAGMRQRARAAGGELRAGPRPGGGFQVAARLPLPEPG